MCVSKGALERIEFPHTFTINGQLASLTSGPRLLDVLQCLTANPLMKAFLFYKTPWYWNELKTGYKSILDELERAKLTARGHHQNGEWAIHPQGEFIVSRIVSDLPVRQLFFHGPHGIWFDEDIRNPSARGMIMAYCDARDAEYWAVLARKNRPRSVADSDDDPVARDYARFGVDRGFIGVFSKYVGAALGGLGVNLVGREQVVTAYFMNWMEPPYYGGWHAWNMTYKPWDIRGEIACPFAGEHIFIAGEVVSPDQGWIEGALRSVERVLQNEPFRLGMPKLERADLAELLLASHYAKNPDEYKEEREKSPEAVFERYLSW